MFALPIRQIVNTMLYTNELYYDKITEWLQSKSEVLCVEGESDIGKSVPLSSWITRLMELQTENLIVILQFVGYGNNHSSTEFIKNTIFAFRR